LQQCEAKQLNYRPKHSKITWAAQGIQ